MRSPESFVAEKDSSLTTELAQADLSIDVAFCCANTEKLI